MQALWKPRPILGCASGARKRPLPPAQAVVERRAADVLVLGDSTVAAATAYSLAKRGKKVVLLTDFGLDVSGSEGGARPQEVLRPLIIPDTTPQMIGMLSDASGYLHGLQLQCSTPLTWPCPTLDLGPVLRGKDSASTSAGPAGAVTGKGAADGATAARTAAETLEQVAEACKAAGVRLSTSLTDVPMIQAQGLAALLQPDGAVVNAAAVHGALTSLSGRQGVLVRDRVQLRGWQDTGSTFTVRCSSRLQPEVESEFVVEQLVLAPDSWPADALRLFNLDMDIQLRSRSSLAVPAGSDQAKSPLLRYWGGLNSSSSSSSNAVLPLQPQLAGQQRGATTSSKPGSKVAGGVTGPAQGAPDASSKWVLNPTVSGSTRAKLTTSAVAGQLLPSCCEARVPKGEPQLIKVARDTPASELEEVVRAATTGAGSSSRKAAVNGVQADELLLQAARAEAVQLVKGLQAEQPSSEDEVESEASSAGRPGSQQKVTRARPVTAVDVLTPDGMPVLGWHPEFEEGRVLVALCASGAWSAPSVGNLDSSSSISSSTVTASTHISTSNTGGDGSSTSSTQPAVWGSAGTDGWALSPLLAKGAANLICGVAATDSSLDMRLLSVKRPQLQARPSQLQPVLGDWADLQALQDGSRWWQQVKAGLSDEQQQALLELSRASATSVSAVGSRPRV